MKLIICYILTFLLFSGFAGTGFGQQTGSCMGIPWNSSFPVIERAFPGVEFVEEDGFRVTLFQLLNPEEDVIRVEFKLFKNQLISVLRYYKGSINQLINEEYVSTLVKNIGPIQEIRKTTAHSLAGTVDVDIYEYADVLVLFRHYPANQKEGVAAKVNSIVIIYKPTFDKMVYYRKHSEGDVEEIIDYDYIEY